MTYLDRILQAHREMAQQRSDSLDSLISRAQNQGAARGFAAALKAADGLGVIAEVKRRSPSKGDLNPDLIPEELAQDYVRGGAHCLSVLTDVAFFGGSVADLQAARLGVEIPVLRKDFTVCAHDVCDAKIMGADAVLLIVAALDDQELGDFHTLAIELGLDALVETHDEREVERALAVGATLIGVNQRDLVTFEVDTDRAVRVAANMPRNVVKVAESGVDGPGAARRLAVAGYDAVLVGESFVTSDDPVSAIRAVRNG